MLIPDGVRTVLTALNVPEDEIALLSKELAKSADQITGIEPAQAQSPHFGGSDMASNLGYHSSLAQDRLSSALVTMTDLLLEHAQGLDGFVADVDQRDQETASTLTAIQQELEAVMPPPATDPSSGPPPADQPSGGQPPAEQPPTTGAEA